MPSKSQKNSNSNRLANSGLYSRNKRGVAKSHTTYPDYYDSDDVYHDRRGNSYYNTRNHSRNSNRRNHSHSQNNHTRKYKKSISPGITKEEWVLANYSFLIRPPSQVNNTNEGILRDTVSDPDSLIDWNAIEVVRYKTEHVEQCPICMDEFVAPRVTKCGHLFCLPCIMRYLSDSEYNHRKCPMCNESIYLEHLKPVLFESIGKLCIGREEQFTLMKRKKHSIIIYGADKIVPPMCSIHVILDEPDAEFNRYIVTYDIDGILHQNLESLRKYAENNSEDQMEVYFLEAAQNEIINKIVEWNTWRSHHLPHGNPAVTKKEKHIQKYLSEIEEYETSSNSNSNHEVNEVDEDESDIKWKMSRGISSKNTEKEKEVYYYFYQSSDGNSVYIDNLSSRILAAEYGGYENLPPSLNAIITHIENIKVDDEIRNKFVFSKHLPYNAEISVVEIDVKPLVSTSVYSKFESEIERRQFQRHLHKERERKMEERAKRQAEEDEERMRKEIERERFSWNDTDFPRVDQYGAEIVPSSSEFVPLDSSSNRKPPTNSKSLRNSQWKNSFIPVVETSTTNNVPNTRVQNSVWTNNDEAFPELSSASKRRKK